MSEIRGLNVDALAEWLIDRIAQEMEISPEEVSVDATFDDLGMNSLKVLIVANDLAEFLKVEEVPQPLFFNYPTIQRLAEHLIGEGRGTART
jgi:8-amino-7-oxononanoate synthase